MNMWARWEKEYQFGQRLGCALQIARDLPLADDALGHFESICERLDIAALPYSTCGGLDELLLYVSEARALAREIHQVFWAMCVEKLLYDIRLQMSTPEDIQGYRSYMAEQAIDAELRDAAAEDRLEELLYG